MSAQNSKSKRYENESLDFIIPCLINQSCQKLKQPQPVKKYSVPNHLRESQSRNLEKIAKIYNIKNPKAKKTLSYHNIISTYCEEPSLSVKKTSSATNYTTAQKPKKKRPSIVRVYSQINHSPVSEMSSTRIKHYYRKKLKKDQSQINESPLLGITFRQKPKQIINLGVQEMLSPESQLKLESFRNEVKRNMKYWKDKKDWDKMRGLNVDFIVNRNCKNFKDLISEYRRRMQIQETSKVFIFDSKDSWMKRVLIDRGWVQNTNKLSKAFHLHWSNKIYKERMFTQQLCNHYDKSQMVTTKIGLHNLLKKYGLAYLQPKTFDLLSQKHLFVKQFQKIQFACLIRKFLDKFEFEAPLSSVQLEDVVQQIKDFSQRVDRQDGNHKDGVEGQLFQVVKYCESILSNNFATYDRQLVTQCLGQINSSYALSTDQKQAIKIIRDFESILAKQSIISHYCRIGTENVWITKSKTSSKGVGITLYNNLEMILKHQNRLAQKYIEKPLIITNSPFLGRKFDLRVWVLLVGNGPQAYYHQRFYGRICYENYGVSAHNLKNESIHLTNYSQNRQRFSKKKELAQSIVLPQMLFEAVSQSFKIDYTMKFYGELQKIIKKLLIIFQDEVVSKQLKNNFQLFGFDFLLDSALHLHLLEINLAAHCEERHQSLTEMLENMGHGILNILEDAGQDSGKECHGWVNIK